MGGNASEAFLIEQNNQMHNLKKEKIENRVTFSLLWFGCDAMVAVVR